MNTESIAGAQAPGPPVWQSAHPVDLSRPYRPSVRTRIGEAWRSWHLYGPLARRIVPTYRGRILGRWWLIIRPFMQVAGFGLIFGGVFHAKAPNGVPYMLFMIFSFQAFLLIEFTALFLTKSAYAIRFLVRRLRVPLLLIPFAGIFRGLISLGVYWAVAGFLLAYFALTKGHFYLQISPHLLVGVLGLVLCLLYGLALGLFTSAIYPRARDMNYFVRYGMQLWLFATPVFYSVESLSHTWRVVIQFNPFTGLVGMAQYGFLSAGELHPYAIAWSVGSLVLLGAVGLWFFNRMGNQWICLYAPKDAVDDEDEDEEGVLI